MKKRKKGTTEGRIWKEWKEKKIIKGEDLHQWAREKFNLTLLSMYHAATVFLHTMQQLYSTRIDYTPLPSSTEGSCCCTTEPSSTTSSLNFLTSALREQLYPLVVLTWSTTRFGIILPQSIFFLLWVLLLLLLLVWFGLVWGFLFCFDFYFSWLPSDLA